MYLPALHRILFCCLLAGLGVLVSGDVTGQRTVNLLRADLPAPGRPVVRAASEVATENFDFDRNLIFFEAMVDGRPGNFILDTGVPTLVMNTRGETSARASFTGMGSGGDVRLTDHRVDHFEMLGRSVDNYWAIGLDLRDMESRTGKQIDGFVGYDLLNDGELRIDYVQETFQLLPSRRRPEHGGRAPVATLRFTLVDHLPVVQLRIDGRRYSFAIDTGAGLNLLADWAADALPTVPGHRTMNVQGLDGRPTDYPVLSLALPDRLAGEEALQLVRADLSHLQDPGATRLAGILGSSFLSRYTVGIDYRRRKIYLW
ncbi:pepsin/retropepsin-like aspartic protease family protein [Lewinella sp. IMCC34183]|uniref:pepsin/retropepsin-like aspartic protease family protein n=1 Tax=Lewinella sp. IMCC34183 TaxID=2248762 RepID=UPI000E26885F|nr:pepsin/retropepsin-like aspartic protease family protein [Lewinella sp. IMCC34183]